MNAPRSLNMFDKHSLWLPILCVCSLTTVTASPAAAVAQDQAIVDAIAGVLAVEDARAFDAELLSTAALHPEPMVRRRAALAIGRIGDPNGTTMLLELLEDPAAVVQQDAAFALGILGDRSAAATLREMVLGTSPSDQGPTHVEAVTAIARIEGGDASDFFEELLVRWVGRAVAGDELPATVVQVLREAWRLGEDAPAERLAQYAEAPGRSARIASLYSLMRLKAAAGANAFVRALDDDNRHVRAIAVRALTAEYADSAGLDRGGTAGRILTLVEDDDPHVRINALRTLGSYENPVLFASVANGLSDSDPNGRVQALVALGQIGGSEAEALLTANVDRGSFAERRQALLSLARVAHDVALVRCAGWIISDEWLMRSAGIEALGIVGGDTALAWLGSLTRDEDARVVGRALTAIEQVDSTTADDLARELLLHADPVVRAIAAGRIQDTPQAADVELLTEAYGLSLRDGISDARTAIVRALGAFANLGAIERIAVEESFLSRFPTSDDYLVRRVASDTFAAAAVQWGAVTPIETGRNPEDYRDIARRLVLPAEQDGELPGLVIQTEYGDVMITLYAAEAPITVDALLQLADRHYFDGGNWHRVVPNFVIQDGDPRGDGWGGPDFSLRDENSRRRYGRGTVGMALSGPDTGGSQFFITHSAQPHLDGTYAVVGQVDQGMDVVDRITMGDRIRTIRRR
ncbi:peptidylprolyl isomerase [Gemmatimonadota bacterium]